MNRKKKIIQLLIAMGIGALLLPVLACAASLSVEDASIAAGDTVSISIAYTADISEVSSMNFDLNYDSSQLSLSSVSLGDAGTAASKSVAHNGASAGVEKIIVYGLNANVIGDGGLIDVTFAVSASAIDGDVAVTPANIIAADALAGAVSVSATAGAITVDSSAPTVEITSHSDGDIVGSAGVTIEGTIDDDSISEVDVNGTSVAVTNGSFSVELVLVEGSNVITVTAVDAVGNAGSSVITLSYNLGDVNEDGIINLTDVHAIRDQILGSLAVSLPADVNSDGSVNVLDLQIVINKL